MKNPTPQVAALLALCSGRLSMIGAPLPNLRKWDGPTFTKTHSGEREKARRLRQMAKAAAKAS